MYRLFIDLENEASSPPDCIVANTEVDFLRYLTAASSPIILKGRSLCKSGAAVLASKRLAN